MARITIWKCPYRQKEDEVSEVFNTIDEEVSQMGKRKKKKKALATSQENLEEPDETKLKQLAALKADRCLCTMKQSTAEQSVIATGGKENDLQIWDLNRPGTLKQFL